MRSALVRLSIGAVIGACSAPSPDEAPDRGPTPSPAELQREARAVHADKQPEGAAASPPVSPSAVPQETGVAAGPRPAQAASSPPATPPSASGPDGAEPSAPDAAPPAATVPAVRPPPPVAATAREQLPSLPFTAYTTVPLAVGGVDLRRTGVRVEVTGISGDRAEVLCSACPAPATGKPAVVPLDRLRAGRAPGGTGDALDTVLMLRARWAGGASLPAGATNIEMCTLADHGFVLDSEQAIWSHAGGTVVLRWSGEVWDLAEDPTRPTEATGWSCRAGGQLPSPPPRSPEAP